MKLNIIINTNIWNNFNQTFTKATIVLLVICLCSCEKKAQSYEASTINFSHPPGFYNNEIPLIISTKEEGKLYYTINGKTPKIGSSYTHKVSDEPIETSEIKRSALYTIRTNWSNKREKNYPWKDSLKMPYQGISIKVGRFVNDSLIDHTCVNYIISADLPEYQIESIMINIDKDDLFDPHKGIYVTGDTTSGFRLGKENYFKKGKDWRRACNFQYFNSSGDLQYNSDADLAIHGLFSQSAPQKSIRLYAKKKYGHKTFNFDFFNNGVSKFKRLVIRSSFSAWKSGIYTDCFISEACQGLNMEVGSQKPVIIYLNGEYWGIHFLAEKIDRYYVKYKFETPLDSIDICRDNTHADHGNSQTFKDLMHFFKNNDLKQDSNYNHVATNLDIPNIIDWYAAETFFQNQDWPCNNTKLWKKSSTLNWRNFLVDFDGAINKPEYDFLNRIYNFTHKKYTERRNRCNIMFQSLMRNAEFRKSFQKRYLELLNKDFSSDNLAEIFKPYDALFQKTDLVSDHKKRWAYPIDNSFEKWHKNLSIWIKIRPEKAREHVLKIIAVAEKDAKQPFKKYTY